MHLAAIDPILQHQEALKQIGFDSVTHYVFLPEWKGAYQQDFSEAMNKKAQLWNNYQTNTALPYVPSITPGWDANPRGVDYGKEKEGRYPWSPIIINNNPETFAQFAQKAAYFAKNVSNFLSQCTWFLHGMNGPKDIIWNRIKNMALNGWKQ